jgi:lysophospholipase L1-like esterase
MYPNKKIKVISCGRPRYTSYSNKIILNEIGETIAPDLIITYMGINDNVYNSFSWLNDSPNVGYFNWKDSKISVFYDALKYYLYVKPFRSNSSFTSIRSKSIFTNNLEEIILWASNHNSRLLLTTFAISYPTTDKNLLKKLLVQEPTIKHFWGDLPSTAKGTDAHNEVSLMLANKYHLPLAPVASNIPKDSKHFLDLCHLTEDGYKILVNTLIETLFHNTASS